MGSPEPEYERPTVLLRTVFKNIEGRRQKKHQFLLRPNCSVFSIPLNFFTGFRQHIRDETQQSSRSAVYGDMTAVSHTLMNIYFESPSVTSMYKFY